MQASILAREWISTLVSVGSERGLKHEKILYMVRDTDNENKFKSSLERDLTDLN